MSVVDGSARYLGPIDCGRAAESCSPQNALITDARSRTCPSPANFLILSSTLLWTDLLWRSRQRLSTVKLASQHGIERYFRETFISELHFYRIAALDIKTLRTIAVEWRVDDCLQFYSRERSSMLEFTGENKIQRGYLLANFILSFNGNCRSYGSGFNLNLTRKLPKQLPSLRIVSCSVRLSLFNVE